MKGLFVVALCVGALVTAGVTSAAPPTRHTFDVALAVVRGGSTATEGIVRDAPLYFGHTGTAPWSGEVGVEFARIFNASRLRGLVTGTIIVVGPSIRWEGKMFGVMTPEGVSGWLVAKEETFAGAGSTPTGRKFVGSWGYTGHPDQSRPHAITIHFDGLLLE